MVSTRWTSRSCLTAAVIFSVLSGSQLHASPDAGGLLAPCPASPNCVSSQGTSESQRVAPLRYGGDEARARGRLMDVLNRMEGVRIVRDADGTVHAAFRSALFGFVDDVEFRFDPPGQVQVRSASQSGYYDFGVNRRRVEAIRSLFEQTGDVAPQ